MTYPSQVNSFTLLSGYKTGLVGVHKHLNGTRVVLVREYSFDWKLVWYSFYPSGLIAVLKIGRLKL